MVPFTITIVILIIKDAYIALNEQWRARSLIVFFILAYVYFFCLILRLVFLKEPLLDTKAEKGILSPMILCIGVAIIGTTYFIKRRINKHNESENE